MLLSTTLNTLNPVEAKGGYPAKEIMDMLYDAGFRAMDFCAFRYAGNDMEYGSTHFFSDHWKEWVEDLAQHARDKGIVFNQSHNLTFNFFEEGEQTKLLNQAVDRGIEASAMLGVPVTVLHPIEPPGANGNLALCLEKNREYFKRKADYAAKFGVKLALENMLSNFRFDGSTYWRYCTTPEQLMELVEAVNMPNVGICYDIGHAHYMRGNVPPELRMVKDHLLCLHVHDNDRWNDSHLLPYQGTVNWEEICRTLPEIGYTGDFTLEIANAVSRMPRQLQPNALRSAFEVAQYLVSRIEFHQKKN